MRLPLSWIKEYIDLSQTPEEIAKILTMAGLEVDAVETLKPTFQGVVVAEITHVEKHPNADKLTLTRVTDGEESYQVVCGAPNCRVGMRVAFAKIGALLHFKDGTALQIKQAKIRSVESCGMLCAADELQIDGVADGIVDLPSDLGLGTDLASFYSDVVFEISLTPNLNHCASVMGVVRELSAATRLPMKTPRIHVEESSSESTQQAVKVTVVDTEGCPRYACRLIKNVVLKPSPAWLQRRLQLCGIRPVNNVVDVTNYVLMEMGHPLHAFDFDRLEGGQIIVKFASDGESFTTLDGKARVLSKDDLVICDQSRPIAISGIMGGANTEVSDATKDVLLESAYFHPRLIRKTSKRLGLQTDSSKRFERGSDPNNVISALNRAAMLIQELADGVPLGGVIDVKKGAFPEKVVTCRMSRINHVLGTHLSVSEAEDVFNRLQFHCSWDGQDLFTVQIPTYRVDIGAEIDLIEEVARIYGYENITKKSGSSHPSQLPHAPVFLFERDVRGRLIAQGLQEFLTCDLIGPSQMDVVKEEAMPPKNIVRVMNPTSIEQSTLRSSLLPGLLQVVKYNRDHQQPNVHGFEVGRIHFKDGDQYIQYKEQSMAGIILTGKRAPHHWDEKPRDVDFYDLKGVVEALLVGLGIEGVTFKNLGLKAFHSGRQASLFIDSLELGSMGEIHPAILRRLDVTQRILFAEINLHDLFQSRQPGEQRMVPLPVYPGSDRDWTVTLNEAVPVEKVFSAIRTAASPYLEDVSLLDIYRSDKLGKDLKNLTFRFVYRAKGKTIDQATVDAEHQRLIEIISNNLTTL
jgi:phenylalanyl-tRNA synthetase beta chain